MNLRFLNNFSGKCFLSLNTNVIEDIGLQYVGDIEPNYLIKTWPYFEKFRKLRFESYDGNGFTDIAECISLCSKLKELDLNTIPTCTENDLIKSIASAKNLESLSLNDVAVTDTELKYISLNLLELKNLKIYDCRNISLSSLKLICMLEKLEELDLSYCQEVSDHTLELFGGLSKLKVLVIVGIDKITGSGLSVLTKLKELNCIGCKNLENNGVIGLLRSVPNLEKFDISGCIKITNSVVDVAIQVTKVRTNNVVLKLCIRDTAVDIVKIEEKSSLLHLHLQ